MKALTWIIILIVVVGGIWWYVAARNKNGTNSSGYNTSGQVQGASDMYNTSTSSHSTSTDNSGQFNSKG